jgi:hypothetical protein
VWDHGLVAVSVIFVEHPGPWHSAFESWGGEVGRWMAAKTIATSVVAKAEAPHPGGPAHGRSRINYATGELAASIHPTFDHWTGPGGRHLEGRVVAVPDHAVMVHEGTRPHMIVPRRAPKLVFFWARKGHVVRFDAVSHPGTQPDPYLWRAVEFVFSRTEVV